MDGARSAQPRSRECESYLSNQRAQRVIDGKASGAKLIVFDTRLSNTATHADHFISPYPGSEAAILLSIANYLIQNSLYNREFVRRWWNWEEYLAQRSEVGDQRSDKQPRSGEMFIGTEPINDAIRSQQNAAHFVESERDSNRIAEAINISRLRRSSEDNSNFGEFERILKTL